MMLVKLLTLLLMLLLKITFALVKLLHVIQYINNISPDAAAAAAHRHFDAAAVFHHRHPLSQRAADAPLYAAAAGDI